MNKERIPQVFQPELVIALVGRMGADLSDVIDEIKGNARKFKYQSEDIKITDIFGYLDHKYELNDSNVELRYSSYIKACNDLRRDSKRKDIFSLLAANYIKSTRINIQSKRSRGTVYIVNQIKKPEEISALKSIYGEAFVVVSCHAPYEQRLASLAKKIALGHGRDAPDTRSEQEAERLIEVDEKEANPWGQNVRAAFPQADCIVDTTKRHEVAKTISRLFRLLFGNPKLSPSFEEYANNLASQAALRSNDLSRQVGAAIFDEHRTVISLGSNEVPRAGGGTYWNDHEEDGRDINSGHDPNTVKKRKLVIDVVERLQKNGMLAKEWEGKDEDDLLSELIGNGDGVLGAARILDILEYGRALHAEMNAITDASRSTRSTMGATLYVTTFPCHNCAKHIVGSGISNVFYLEPYAKSEVGSLYPDSICVDPSKPSKEKVNFQQFCGITKQRFHLFSKSKLKDASGRLIAWKADEADCLLRNNPSDFDRYEALFVDQLVPALAKAGVSILPGEEDVQPSSH